MDELKPLAPRQPYDAPNWVRLDRQMRFDELTEYPGQLQATGAALAHEPDAAPAAGSLSAGESGIRTELKYHHSAPTLRMAPG